MRLYYLFICFVLFYILGCNSTQHSDPIQNERSEDPCEQEIAPEDTLFYLYNYCVDVIEKPDTVYVINHRLDTTIIYTGIFVYLQHDYPVSFYTEVTDLIEKAIHFERVGSSDSAGIYYQKVIDYHKNERPKKLAWFTDDGQSIDYYVGTAILASYAYEKTGDTANAVSTLKPALNYAEVSRTQVLRRYDELCSTSGCKTK